MIKTYSELITIPTFEGRFEYLMLEGSVGHETFGYDRIFNQMFYKSKEWMDFRKKIIVRDTGLQDRCCDLACPDREIFDRRIIIHHINPITMDDIKTGNEKLLLNPENVVCTIHDTHNAIHYGDSSLLAKGPVNRKPNDTCPWKM